jgi:hypothetical protein
VATKDRTVQPELQRFVAKRMGATLVEVESSHRDAIQAGRRARRDPQGREGSPERLKLIGRQSTSTA